MYAGWARLRFLAGAGSVGTTARYEIVFFFDASFIFFVHKMVEEEFSLPEVEGSALFFFFFTNLSFWIARGVGVTIVLLAATMLLLARFLWGQLIVNKSYTNKIYIDKRYIPLQYCQNEAH